ncbi:MAG TPA: hypothetical protein PK263_04215 [bacterium]|nr:hypothetical protein [bacterium]
MTLLRNLFFLFSVTLFAVASMVLSIFNYNPYSASQTAFINFYTSFLVSATGILAIVIFYAKTHLFKKTKQENLFWPSVRQALFISIAATTILLLQGLRILDITIGISTVVVTILLELFFQTKRGEK